MPSPTETTSQVDTNYFQLYKEESNLSIGESSCIVILIYNIKFSSNFSIENMDCLLIKNSINTPLHLQFLRDFPVYCKIRLQKQK